MLDAHVVKRRPQFTIDVAVAVASGEACGLFGSSGAGKSTVLSCIAGFEVPDAGRIVVDETHLFPPSLPLHRRPVGYLSQDAQLFPHLSIRDNVRFGLTDRSDPDGGTWIAELRSRLELDGIWDAPARRVSGGQARRAAFARMLARRPRVVLLDEPFAGLDRHLVRELLAAIDDWRARLGFTLVIVDHEAAILERVCSRVLAIESGRVVQDGDWGELHARPATPLLARLLAPL